MFKNLLVQGSDNPESNIKEEKPNGLIQVILFPPKISYITLYKMVVNAPSSDLISSRAHCACISCEWLCPGDSHVTQSVR